MGMTVSDETDLMEWESSVTLSMLHFVFPLSLICIPVWVYIYSRAMSFASLEISFEGKHQTSTKPFFNPNLLAHTPILRSIRINKQPIPIPQIIFVVSGVTSAVLPSVCSLTVSGTVGVGAFVGVAVWEGVFPLAVALFGVVAGSLVDLCG